MTFLYHFIGGRKSQTEEIQTKLLRYIEEERKKQLAVGHNKIQRKAIQLAREEGNLQFNASNGW